MAFASRSTSMVMQHDEDPAKVIRKAVGDLSKFRLMGNQVLVGIYLRPEKTKANIILPDTVRGEDAHQGKAGLVLLKGQKAFVSDSNYDFGSDDVSVGDWVAVFVSDGRKIVVNGALCRIIEDTHIRLKLPSPDCVY